MSDYQSDLPDNQTPNTTRRRLIFGAAGAAASLGGFSLVQLALAKSDEDAVSSLTRWGLLIDTEKCATDCDACVSSCNTEHNLEDMGRPETDAQWIRKLDLSDQQTGHVSSLPMMCQHCEDPPCVDVCPTGASFKRDDGIVMVDKHTCIGCRYCVMACPYKARSFIHEKLSNQKSYSPRGKGTVESCNLCVHRIDQGRQPACVEACNTDGNGAMVFGDLNDSGSEIAVSSSISSSRQIREDLGLNTGVRYQNL
ncbi:MAG: 4Fe-4S dicluster domain-containing protein [Gammaproteobacteria bacterium]|nr:4Fe-4S dicluster domain-containing protein [Gammaproteobacteria bacterium]NKB64002.1 4Fe-4S dicluster domain-containing protein [Gammaproteobacteria bacterium]